jgi:hypothetical protein
MCVKMEFAFKPVLLLYVVSSQVRCWRQFSVLIQKMFCPAMYQFYLLRITYVTISDATSLFNEPIISRHEKSSSRPGLRHSVFGDSPADRPSSLSLISSS